MQAIFFRHIIAVIDEQNLKKRFFIKLFAQNSLRNSFLLNLSTILFVIPIQQHVEQPDWASITS